MTPSQYETLANYAAALRDQFETAVADRENILSQGSDAVNAYDAQLAQWQAAADAAEYTLSNSRIDAADPVAAPIVFDQNSPPAQPSAQSAAPMTAEQFANDNPDLALNWNRANSQQWLAENPGSAGVAEQIRSFGTFGNYLIAAHGGPFDATATAAAGGGGTTVTTGGETAQQFANAHPDLAVNWSRASSPQWVAQNPGSASLATQIMGYGSFQNYLLAAHGGPFAGGGTVANPAPVSVAASTTTTTTTGGGTTTTLPPGSSISLAKPTIPVGTTASGLTIYQLVDSGGLVKQWIVGNGSGILDLVNAPTYGVLMHTQMTDAPATAPGNGLPGGGGTTQGLARPTIQVGTTRTGLPVKQLVDEGGTVKQWIESPQGTLDLINATTYGTMLHTAATDATAAPASLAKPTIQVGATAAGLKIYQLVDEGGTVKQWIVNAAGQILDLTNATTYGTMLHDSVTDAAVADNGGGTVTTTTKADNTQTLILAGAALLLGFMFLQSRNR